MISKQPITDILEKFKKKIAIGLIGGPILTIYGVIVLIFLL